MIPTPRHVDSHAFMAPTAKSVVVWVEVTCGLWADIDVSEQHATFICKSVVCRFRNGHGCIGNSIHARVSWCEPMGSNVHFAVTS
jgi:hypothetical protein